MRQLQRVFWAQALCLLLSCGGTTSLGLDAGGSAGAGTDGSAAAANGGAGAAGAPGAAGAGGHAGGLPACAKSAGAEFSNRATAGACPPSVSGTTAMACSTDSDCALDGGVPNTRCLNHMCTVGDCLVDADCPGHDVCTCASAVQFYNLCAPADCRIDADCGPGGICAATEIPSCASGPMYTCLSAADTCCSYADCSNGGAAIPCQFVPTVGHFQCVPVPTCVGGI